MAKMLIVVPPLIGTLARAMLPFTMKLESVFTGSAWKLYCASA